MEAKGIWCAGQRAQSARLAAQTAILSRGDHQQDRRKPSDLRVVLRRLRCGQKRVTPRRMASANRPKHRFAVRLNEAMPVEHFARIGLTWLRYDNNPSVENSALRLRGAELQSHGIRRKFCVDGMPPNFLRPIQFGGGIGVEPANKRQGSVPGVIVNDNTRFADNCLDRNPEDPGDICCIFDRHSPFPMQQQVKAGRVDSHKFGQLTLGQFLIRKLVDEPLCVDLHSGMFYLLLLHFVNRSRFLQRDSAEALA